METEKVPAPVETPSPHVLWIEGQRRIWAEAAGAIALARGLRAREREVGSLRHYRVTTRAACFADMDVAKMPWHVAEACWYAWAELTDGSRWLVCLHSGPWWNRTGWTWDVTRDACVFEVKNEPLGDLFTTVGGKEET